MDNNPQDNGTVTNEDLARMIAEGFKDISTRMATKDDIRGVLTHILVVDERVTTVQQGMVRVMDYLDLEKRVTALEQKLEEFVQKQ